jgi:hypothetical protein
MKKILVDKLNLDLASDFRQHNKTPLERKLEHDQKQIAIEAKIKKLRARRESEKAERARRFSNRRATEVGREYQRLERLDQLVQGASRSGSSNILESKSRLPNNYSKLLMES